MPESNSDHTVRISTSMLDNFIYSGTYETLIGKYLGNVPPDEYGFAEAEVNDLALSSISSAIYDMLPYEYDEDYDIEYAGIYHPSYYNFETDSITFDFKYTEDLKGFMYEYVENNDSFDKFLAEKYTSRDGFFSLTPNKRKEWADGWNEDNAKCVSALLLFMLRDSSSVNEQDLHYELVEKIYTLISEGYTPYEYAIRFENGFIGVVRNEYDYGETEDGRVYNAWLLDENNKVINHVQFVDKWDDFEGNAYRAWEYIECDVTNKHELTGGSSQSVRCVVPKFDDGIKFV